MDDRSVMNLKSSDRLKQEVKYAQIIDFRRISYTVRFPMNRINAGLAQLVEQLTCNQQVVGSSPITSSKFLGGFPERPKGADCKSVS